MEEEIEIKTQELDYHDTVNVIGDFYTGDCTINLSNIYLGIEDFSVERIGDGNSTEYKFKIKFSQEPYGMRELEKKGYSSVHGFTIIGDWEFSDFILACHKIYMKENNKNNKIADIETLQEKIFALETNNKKLVEELKHKKEYDQQDIQEKVYEVFNAIEPELKQAIIKVLCE